MSSFFRSRASTASSTNSSSSNLPPTSKTVLPTPDLTAPPTRPPAPQPGSTEAQAYDAIFQRFSDPAFQCASGEMGGREGVMEGLGEGERMWLTEECFLRYLRAQKWDLQSAITKLTSTLVWRRENGLADLDGGESPAEGGGLSAALVKEEGRSGKDYVNGWDSIGRPLHYQVPSRNESVDSALNIKYCVWVMERSIEMMPPGIEKQVLLVSFAGGMSPPPMATVKGWISMLSNHYPERMGKAIAVKVPFVINAFFKLILPWIDPVTREKLSFNEAAPWIPQDQLELPFGGQYNFEYDQAAYLPSLLELCSTRRREYRARWVKDGSRIGASEWYLKGGDEPGYGFNLTNFAPPSSSSNGGAAATDGLPTTTNTEGQASVAGVPGAI